MNDVLHVAFVSEAPFFLRKTSETTFEWQDEEGKPIIFAGSVEEACRLLNQRFQNSLRYLNCGKRFTLPERDEHGSTALFHHLVASQKTVNGIYFDSEFGCSSIVKEASLEALRLSKL